MITDNSSFYASALKSGKEFTSTCAMWILDKQANNVCKCSSWCKYITHVTLSSENQRVYCYDEHSQVRTLQRTVKFIGSTHREQWSPKTKQDNFLLEQHCFLKTELLLKNRRIGCIDWNVYQQPSSAQRTSRKEQWTMSVWCCKKHCSEHEILKCTEFSGPMILPCMHNANRAVERTY